MKRPAASIDSPRSSTEHLTKRPAACIDSPTSSSKHLAVSVHFNTSARDHEEWNSRCPLRLEGAAWVADFEFPFTEVQDECQMVVGCALVRGEPAIASELSDRTSLAQTYLLRTPDDFSQLCLRPLIWPWLTLHFRECGSREDSASAQSCRMVRARVVFTTLDSPLHGMLHSEAEEWVVKDMEALRGKSLTQELVVFAVGSFIDLRVASLRGMGMFANLNDFNARGELDELANPGSAKQCPLQHPLERMISGDDPEDACCDICLRELVLDCGTDCRLCQACDFYVCTDCVATCSTEEASRKVRLAAIERDVLDQQFPDNLMGDMNWTHATVYIIDSAAPTLWEVAAVSVLESKGHRVARHRDGSVEVALGTRSVRFVKCPFNLKDDSNCWTALDRLMAAAHTVVLLNGGGGRSDSPGGPYKSILAEEWVERLRKQGAVYQLASWFSKNVTIEFPRRSAVAQAYVECL